MPPAIPSESHLSDAGSVTEPTPSRSMLAVRVNRRLFGWTAVISMPLAVSVLALMTFFGFGNPADGHLRTVLWCLLYGSLCGLACGAILRLRRSTLLFYSAQSRKITAPRGWNGWTHYPRRGFDRIEYSVYDARIYEVGSDGRRRRIPFKPGFADTRDWEMLVDLLLIARGE